MKEIRRTFRGNTTFKKSEIKGRIFEQRKNMALIKIKCNNYIAEERGVVIVEEQKKHVAECLTPVFRNLIYSLYISVTSRPDETMIQPFVESVSFESFCWKLTVTVFF